MARLLLIPSCGPYVVLLLLWVLTNYLVVGVHHCLAAQRLCSQDSLCSTLLRLISENCGPNYDSGCAASDLVSCKASLKALHLHRIYENSCICTDEPSDVECHNFYDSIFKNPCLAPIINSEVDSQSVVKIESKQTPSCTYAFSICSENIKCKRIFEYFKRVCKVNSGKCRMTSRAKCSQAMTKLQLTPLFGCQCHNQDERCERISEIINYSPCLDELKSVGFHNSDSLGTDEPLTPEEGGPIGFPATHNSNWNDNPLWGRAPASPPPRNPPRQLSKILSVFTNPSDNSEIQLERPPVARPDAVPHNRTPYDTLRPYSPPTIPFTISPHEPRRRQQRVTLPPQDAAQITVVTSTCAWAKEACEADTACNLLLENVYVACDENGVTCNQTECMTAIRNLYHLGNPDKTFDIAFCNCIRPDDDACLVSQRQLHPACAYNVPGYLPGCDDIAEKCMNKEDCKYRLQRFVDECAVDRETLRCQGSTRSCQEALVGILGTPLRTACGCLGNNILSLYKCTDWQRFIWLNPCVVQAQKEFLENRVNAVPLSPKTESNPVQSPSFTVHPTPPVVMQAPTTATVVQSVTTTTTTTPRPIMTTPPPEYCSLFGKDTTTLKIRYGSGRRVYHKDDPDCSSICMCDKKGALVCKVLPCDERLPCQTSFAVYSHSSPAYQAHRGRCICYSGNFICMKPAPQLYTLRQGVFVFFGYSELEERLLSPYTQLSILDSVERLQRLMEESSTENGGCKLKLFKHIGENIVMQAYLDEFSVERENNSIVESMILKEKELCYPQLKNLTHLINSNDVFVKRDISMSLFKLAEVEVHVQEPNAGSSLVSSKLIHLLTFGVFTLLWTFSISHSTIPTTLGS